MRVRALSALLLASLLAAGGAAQPVLAGNGAGVDAEARTRDDPDPPPPPPSCWWERKEASARDRADEQGFWRQIDGGDHAEDVIVFFEDGYLHRSFTSEQRTYVLQVRVCSDPNDDEAGRERWTETGPPNPTVLWDELVERVYRRVPLPEPELGFEAGPDGTVRIVVNVGLWVAVGNFEDVVARAEPAPGVWAETRATLDHIEFLSGTGRTSGECRGAGTPLPDDDDDVVGEGPCGYTYERVDELGQHTAILRAVWTVTNTTSTGASENRPPIILETPIPVDVYEIQTVGVADE